MIIQNLNINFRKNIFAYLLFSVCNIICLLVQQVSLMRQWFEGCFSNHRAKEASLKQSHSNLLVHGVQEAYILNNINIL